MTLYLLDTHVASAAIRGVAAIDARLVQLDPAHWCISAITRSELRHGVALRPAATRLAQHVEAFLQAASTAPWDEEAADRHGRLRAHLRVRGTPIGEVDTMIAAHALSLGAVLVTENVQHFRCVEGLAIESWVQAARPPPL